VVTISPKVARTRRVHEERHQTGVTAGSEFEENTKDLAGLPVGVETAASHRWLLPRV
jgi:hypothetical protein